MTNLQIAKKLKIAEKTLYNWQKNRKELYKIILKGLEYENQEYVKNTEKTEYQKLIDDFKQLDAKEQEYIISKINIFLFEKKSCN